MCLKWGVTLTLNFHRQRRGVEIYKVKYYCSPPSVAAEQITREAALSLLRGFFAAFNAVIIIIQRKRENGFLASLAANRLTSFESRMHQAATFDPLFPVT